MWEMDGCTATKKIREFNDKKKIIAQTAYALTGDREKALESGCNEYIAKPFTRKQLRLWQVLDCQIASNLDSLMISISINFNYIIMVQVKFGYNINLEENKMNLFQ